MLVVTFTLSYAPASSIRGLNSCNSHEMLPGGSRHACRCIVLK